MNAKNGSRRSVLIKIATLLVVLSAVAVLARHEVKEASGSTITASAHEALSGSLPHGVALVELGRSTTPGILRFETAGSDRRYRGESTDEGRLLWMASSMELDRLPADLRESLLQGEAPSPRATVEEVRLLAFEVEVELEGGAERELFVDGLGETLFEVVKAPQTEDPDVPERFEDLPEPVAQAIRRHLGDATPLRLQRETDLGSRLYTAKWRGVDGVQEVKVLENGLTLFVELPPGGSVPPEVMREVPAGAQIEEMLIDAYFLRDENGTVLRAVLANGVPISHRVRASVR